jgi:hypothetical protein
MLEVELQFGMILFDGDLINERGEIEVGTSFSANPDDASFIT